VQGKYVKVNHSELKCFWTLLCHICLQEINFDSNHLCSMIHDTIVVDWGLLPPGP